MTLGLLPAVRACFGLELTQGCLPGQLPETRAAPPGGSRALGPLDCIHFPVYPERSQPEGCRSSHLANCGHTIELLEGPALLGV